MKGFAHISASLGVFELEVACQLTLRVFVGTNPEALLPTSLSSADHVPEILRAYRIPARPAQRPI